MKPKLYCEVAITPEQRELGLQYVNKLSWDQGMLFYFKQPTTQGFWMKNTGIPLDLIFLNNEHMILQISQLHPGDMRIIECSKPYKYAIEVNQGWCESYGIRAGMNLHEVVDLVL